MARIKKLQESGATIYPATIMNAVKDIDGEKTLPEVLDDLKEGNYPKMSVGFAENIVGDGTATEEEFTFRPTAGINRNVQSTTYDYDMRSNFGARIESVKGNSVVYNQLFDKHPSDRSYDNNGVHIVDNLDGSFTIWTDDSGATAQVNRALGATHNFSYSGNKLLITGCEGAKVNFGFWDSYSNTIGTNFSNNKIITASGDGAVAYSVIINSGVVISRTKWRPKVYNLSQMFGAGNEPTTVEEFYSLLPKNVDLNAYNEGEIVDAHYKGIKTTGFNQWDEQSIEGIYNTSNGLLIEQSDCLSSKNPIKVVGGCPYVITAPNYTGYQRVVFYDEQMNVIGNSIFREFTTPQNCRYVNFSLNTYGSIYNGDVCVHLAWEEYSALNGTYAPYKTFERDLLWISKYFNEGKMRRAGSAFDEIRFNSTTQKWEAVQRIGVVDLGSLTWTLATNNRFFASLTNAKPPQSDDERIEGIVSSKYSLSTNVNPSEIDDKSMIKFDSGTTIRIYVRDTVYADVSSFTTAMQGVMLNYELATPIVKEIEEIPNLDFDVADYGTEELIAPEGVKSAPFHADIIYTPNALKTLEQVPDILRRLAAVETAMTTTTTTTE